MSGEVGQYHDHLRCELHNIMVVVTTVKSIIIMLTIHGIILTFVCDDHYHNYYDWLYMWCTDVGMGGVWML